MGLGALGALLGAILLWKFWALPKISHWITSEGSTKLKEWLASVVEDPEGESAKEIGKLTGVVMAYGLQGMQELFSTKEGRERLAPIMEVIQEHIQQSIFATWGHILGRLKNAGESIPGMDASMIPPELLGLGEKIMPKGFRDAGIGLPQMLNLASFLTKFKIGGNAGDVSSTGGAHGGWKV